MRALLEGLLARPRTRLARLPTPLLPAPRLSRHLDDRSEILVKMDAETGFALGGNKVRKLEHELAPERLEGVTCLITGGGPQSNHCRVTAAFAARHGLDCILVVNGPEPERPTGNALLHRLFGATIRVVDDRAARAEGLERAARVVEAGGGRPLVVPVGASTGLGCLGYALGMHELASQIDALPSANGTTRLFVSTSSSGTLAGLVLGLALLGRDDVRPVGVSADAPVEQLRAETLRIALEGAAILEEALEPRPGGAEGAPGAERRARPGLAAAGAARAEGATAGDRRTALANAVDRVRFELDADQVGDGYGIPTQASREATRLFAELEGIVLDPTYTAKAAAAVLDWVRSHGPSAGGRVVFLDTGGHPGLLAQDLRQGT